MSSKKRLYCCPIKAVWGIGHNLLPSILKNNSTFFAQADFRDKGCSPFFLTCQRNLRELGEILGILFFYLYPEKEVESFITLLLPPFCNLILSMCTLWSCVMQRCTRQEYRKEETACWAPGPVTEKKAWKKSEEQYLSRMNSAISFCICFPFSCFCSKTSKPVMQLLLWASLLSFCNVSNKSMSQKWQM